MWTRMDGPVEGEHGFNLKNGELWRGDLDELVHQFIEAKADNEKLQKVREAAARLLRADEQPMSSEQQDEAIEAMTQLRFALAATKLGKGSP